MSAASLRVATLPDGALRELGRTEGSTETLGLLVRDQHIRRLVLLRALLDAAQDAPAAVCPPKALRRLHDDWALLEAAERADRAAVRELLLYPLVGPWAQRCLHGLTAAAPTSGLRADLDHFAALATTGALRAGLPFTARVCAREGLLALPLLGALRVRTGPVDLSFDGGELTVRQRADTPVRVRVGADGAHADDPRWVPAIMLPAVLPDGAPVPLDDLHPYRTAGSGLERHGLSAAAGLDEGERKGWAESWAGVEPLLRLGGEHRPAEAAALLRCLVPLAPPPGSTVAGDGAAHCSGTRREAFGAVLSSKPSTPAFIASTLVHELQHTKLAALGELVPLHHEDGEPRHFAPWRSDPRPFDGLLQGAYSHLALADYWQRFALGAGSARHRDLSWAEHARCREQVGAVLPVLAGSAALTREGRILVNGMIGLYDQLADHPPPSGHRARAVAYVSTARVIWCQRNGSPGT
ncbi:HEXXH motif-containing putative peptide modification protein [Streptomyces sp. NPDC057445]|uniref:aKG-HExxH-type peptide beta-hydroxylase n=1 Tax=Streptomyces sp. NPDC057445 TaxID=3346136 RepID=UPI0036A8F419